MLQDFRLWNRLQFAGGLLPEANGKHRQHGNDKEVGRHGKDCARLLDAAEVDNCDDGDEPQGDLNVVRI